jgi:hypothetical protein
MARKRRQKSGDWIFPNVTSSNEPDDQSSLLDVVDNVLNKGAVLNGDLVLGVANVDLVYAKLSVLLAAIDKVTRDPALKPVAAGPRRKRTRRRTPRKQNRRGGGREV